MTKKEFLHFCHEEFTRRGFKKKRKMYYLVGEDVLGGIYLQKSIGEAYYVNCDFFVGKFQNIKTFPSTYEADYSKRICVWSKDTFNGQHFMDACIEYELYVEDEVRIYFDIAFESYVMPIINEGKEALLKVMENDDRFTQEERKKAMMKFPRNNV